MRHRFRWRKIVKFLLLEDLYETIEKHQELLDKNIHNQVMLNHVETQLDKALEDIEKLKDKVRENKNGNIKQSLIFPWLVINYGKKSEKIQLLQKKLGDNENEKIFFLVTK